MSEEKPKYTVGKVAFSDNYNAISYSTYSGRCDGCRKPFVFVGDMIGDPKDYICTCKYYQSVDDSSANEKEHDPEFWKMIITKISNGYIVRFPNQLGTGDDIAVIEEGDGEYGERDGLINLLWTVLNEFNPNVRIEIEPLKNKYDWTKWDFKELLRDVHKHFTDEDYDIDEETVESIKRIFKEDE